MVGAPPRAGWWTKRVAIDATRGFAMSLDLGALWRDAKDGCKMISPKFASKNEELPQKNASIQNNHITIHIYIMINL